MNDSATVLEIAQRYLEHVKKSGNANIAASCPFHETDNPEGYSVTFSMSLSTGLWHCFSCKEGGNLYQFLQRMQLSHVDLKKHSLLLERLEKNTGRKPEKKNVSIEHLPAIPESLLGEFYTLPVELLHAGFLPSTLKAFDVGVDQKHGRVVYPLRDQTGRLLGISGRGVNPRYKIYDKEYLDWGIAEQDPNVKTAVIWGRKLDRRYPVVLVEGFKACMWVWQAGYRNVAALMGSQLSPQQKKILQTFDLPFTLMLDNDSAGQIGTYVIGKQLIKTNVVSVATYDADQPDKHPIEDIPFVLDNAVPFSTWNKEQERDPLWVLSAKESTDRILETHPNNF